MRRAALAVLLACAGCAHGGRSAPPAVVTAQGWAPDAPGDAEGSRRRAVADALRRAVERGAGVAVTARTRVKDGGAVTSRMVSDAAGCVRRYEVTEERARGGGRGATVRAEVLPPALCGKSPLPPAALEDAAVEVSVTGAGALDRGAARAAASSLRASLAARGWRVVSRGAPWRLSGVASVRPVFDRRVAPFIGASAELALRAERVRDGRVVGEWRTSASALGADAPGAGLKAAEAVAGLAAKDAAEALEGKLWNLE